MTKTIEEVNGITTIRLSDSSINCWDECKKKWYYRYVEHLVPRERIRAFDIGSLVHVGAAVFLRPANAQFDMTTRYTMARAAIVEHFESEMRPLKVERDVLDEATHVFPVIMRRRVDVKPIAVEQWWETIIPIDDITRIQFVGKADVISTMDSAYYIEEHKTINARGFGEKKITQYQKARQTKGYVLLGRRNLKPEFASKLVGVVHNFFLKKKEPELKQEITMVGPRDLERVERNIIDVAKEILYAHRSGYFRENTNACHSWAGSCSYNRLCEFGDNSEIRQQLFTTESRDERLSRLDTISKRTGPAENVSETADKVESGVEERLGE